MSPFRLASITWAAGAVAACGFGTAGLGGGEMPTDGGSDATSGQPDGPTPNDAAGAIDSDAAGGGPADGGAPDAFHGDEAPAEAGVASDPGVVCGDAACPLGTACFGCGPSMWQCTSCVGMPAFILNCDDWADCDGGACCVDMGGGPVTTSCQGGPGPCAADHPLCDPNAANPCPDGGGTCKPADGHLGGTRYYNCRP